LSWVEGEVRQGRQQIVDRREKRGERREEGGKRVDRSEREYRE
jgi:hypothetical protein